MFIEVFIFPSRPDTSIVGSTFQMTGRHDLIGSSRSVEIFAAAPGSLTSGSKAYFLFKLYDSTSGESGRQQQFTTRLSSCILDMCAGIVPVPLKFESFLKSVLLENIKYFRINFVTYKRELCIREF